jgi:glycosyltransferase involved in cell wall biosynthesis
VYNGERFLPETLDSLLAQTYGDFELIICDNASTDGTEQICYAYKNRDKRIKYYRNTINLGAARNYRKTFVLSSGQYFRWANADDLFAPESLARCLDVLEHEPSVILVYGKTRFIDDRGRFIADYDDRLDLRMDNPTERFVELYRCLGYVNVIYGLLRANILRKTKLIRSFVGGDISLVAELALYGKFWEIPEFLFYRRFHPQASSSFTNVAQLQEFFDPRTKGAVPLREWRHLLADFDSVRRAPLAIHDKICLSVFLSRVGFWNRGKLAREILDLFRHQWRLRLRRERRSRRKSQ